MKAYRATRGVCIGVERHLKAGDPVPSDLDAGQIVFLSGIGAIEAVPSLPPMPPAAVDGAEPAEDAQGQKAMDLESKTAPAEGGRKKK